MARGSAVTRPRPLPPPQVLLSQVHRLRALDLLGRFLDLGPWAVSLVRAGPARVPGVGGDKPLCLGVTRHRRGTAWGAGPRGARAVRPPFPQRSGLHACPALSSRHEASPLRTESASALLTPA